MSYKGLKKKEYSGEFFRTFLNIPESYRWTDVDTKVIAVVKKEFEKTNITNLKLIKDKVGRDVNKVILTWDIKEPEIIKEEPKKKPKKEEKKEEIEDIKIVEPEDLTPEEEQKGLEKLISDGMDKGFIETMKRNNKTMYINFIRACLKGVE